jgi:hypothetical protein
MGGDWAYIGLRWAYIGSRLVLHWVELGLSSGEDWADIG